jgi:hypothetical protein
MLRRAMLSGDGSTLNLNFTQMSTLADLTSRGLTFSRSTSGTYLNANGLVATATAGNPRFDYDTSGNPRGILIEGSATNLVYHSETFRLTAVAAEPYWADSASVSRGNDTAPDGTAGAAVNIIAIGTAGTVIQTAAVGSSANRTFSFWAKRTGGGTVEYTLDNGSTWTAVTITANWVRYTATATNANQRVGFRVATGAGTSIWGAMLEAGSGSSSYIPSGASQGTRNRDQVALTNLSSMNFSQTEGTCLATVEVREKADNTFLPYGSFNTSGGGRCWLWLRHNLSPSVGTRLLGSASNSGGATILTTANYLYNSGNGGVVKFATSLNTGTSSMVYVISGGAPQITTAAAFTLATAAEWGLNTSNDVNAPDLRSMWVQSFKYWPTALPNAQLQALTT